MAADPEPPSQAWQARLGCYISLPIGIIIVILRIYTRLRLRHGLGSDDYVTIAATVAMAGYVGVMLYQVTDNVYGRHWWDIPMRAFTTSTLKLICATSAANLIAAALVKLSILLFYRRVFFVLHRTKLLVCCGIIGTTVLYILCIALLAVYSVPHRGDGGWFSPAYSARTFKGAPVISVLSSTVGCVTDFYILCIPLVTFSSLRMTRVKKMALSGLLLTGLTACGLSVAGLVVRVKHLQRSFTQVQHDAWWSAMIGYAFSVAELNIGLVCGSMPVCVPTLTTFAHHSSNAWSSVVRTFQRSTTRQSNVDSDLTDGDHVSAITEELPKVPTGTLTGLFTALRVNTATNNKPSNDSSTTELAPWSEIRTVDIDYHKQIV